MRDQLADCRNLRLFNVIDDCNRHGFSIEVDLSLIALRVACFIDQIIDW